MTDHRPLAFVTGAPSGIGYELAKHSPNRAMTSRSPAPANRVHDSARKLRELRGDAWSHQADASTYDGVEAFWRFIESLGRPVEVAVLNVGIATAGSVADTALDDHLKVLAKRHRHHTHGQVCRRPHGRQRQRTDPDRLVGLGDHTHAL